MKTKCFFTAKARALWRKNYTVLAIILCVFFVTCTIYLLVDDSWIENIGPASVLIFAFIITPIFSMIYGVISYLLTKEIVLPNSIYFLAHLAFAYLSNYVLDVSVGSIGCILVILSVLLALVTKGIYFVINKCRKKQS